MPVNNSRLAQQPAKPRRGGQPGNLNALKSGRRSRQVETLVTLLIAVPEFRSVMQALNRDGRTRRLDVFGDALREFQRRSLRNRLTHQSPDCPPAESERA